MKSFLSVLVLVAVPSFFANANEVVVSEREVELNVDISESTVKLSRADYSAAVVKILIPEIADVAILDHRNTNEGAPCMATYETQSPSSVVGGDPKKEKIKFKITLERQAFFNRSVNPDGSLDSGVCEVYLIETINGVIRGFNFNHVESVLVGTRHPDDCR
jgi:hypothetical protein